MCLALGVADQSHIRAWQNARAASLPTCRGVVRLLRAWSYLNRLTGVFVLVSCVGCPGWEQGVFPLGRAQIKRVHRGASGFGVSISSAEVSAGKELVLSMSNERQRDQWFEALERAALVYVGIWLWQCKVHILLSWCGYEG